MCSHSNLKAFCVWYLGSIKTGLHLTQFPLFLLYLKSQENFEVSSFVSKSSSVTLNKLLVLFHCEHVTSLFLNTLLFKTNLYYYYKKSQQKMSLT